MIKKENLLLIAAFVWFTAGFILLLRGLMSYNAPLVTLFCKLLIGIPVGSLFYLFMFRKIVKTHTQRILSMTGEYQKIYRFFNKRSYILMGTMITLGISIRLLRIVPIQFLSVFYVIMGIPLIFSGSQFVFNRLLRK
jgi:hypothetical protein